MFDARRESKFRSGKCIASRLLLLCALVFAVLTPARAEMLIVRGDYAYPPYEFLENGVPSGVNIEIIRAVARVMNLTIKIDLGPWPEVRSQLENGEISIITGMFKSEERDRLVDFSTPHIIVSHAIFARKGSHLSSLSDLKNAEIIVQGQDIMHDYVVKHFKEAQIIVVPTQADAIRLLASGKHDAALLSKLQTQYIIYQEELDNIITVGEPIKTGEYCFAVREGDTALLAQLNEGLFLIKQSGEYDRIREKWFGVFEEKDAWDLIFPYIQWGLGPFLGLVGLTVFWFWSLRKTVRDRTAALRQELTERKRAERELGRSRQLFAAVVEGSPLGMILVDASGTVRLVNEEFTRTCGYSLEDISTLEAFWDKASIPKSCREMMRCDREDCSIFSVNKTPQECRITCKDGAVRHVEMRSRKVADHVLTIVIDITERLRTQEVLLQAEKMSSIGGLAAGMAHEINNPLGAILQGVQNVTRRFSTSLPANAIAAEEAGCSLESIHAYMELRKIDRMLNGIRTSGERAARIVENMLSFSRNGGSKNFVCSVPEIIDKVLDIVGADFSPKMEFDFRKVEIRKEYEDDLPDIPCVETEIEQVLLNLMLNAAQAFSEQENKAEPHRITIALAADGEFLTIRVSDNGPGISKEHRAKIFEPFFTTKAPGRGTGLGLSLSYFIITKNHGGEFFVASQVGHGSTFTIRLPLVSRGVEAEPVPLHY